MEEKTTHNTFVQGAITPAFLADIIAQQSTQTNIGAHATFMGQVRADIIDDKKVSGIFYSAYQEMAEKVFLSIREMAFKEFELTGLNIYHSLGLVCTGEISLFIMASSKHRKDAIEACTFIVEAIKKNVPIWGKEIFRDGSYTWKKNNVSSKDNLILND